MRRALLHRSPISLHLLLDLGVYVQFPLFFFKFATEFATDEFANTVLVDVNPGRSSSAVALNALARGILAAIGTQIAQPAQAKLGNGWFWTGFAAVIVVGEVMILIVRRR